MPNEKYIKLDKKYYALGNHCINLVKSNKKLNITVKNRVKRISSLKEEIEVFRQNGIFLDSGQLQFSTEILNENNMVKKDGNHIILLPKISDRNGVIIEPYTKLYSIKLLYKCVVLNYVSKVLQFTKIPSNYVSEIPRLDVINTFFVAFKYRRINDYRALCARRKVVITTYKQGIVIILLSFGQVILLIAELMFIYEAVVFIYQMYCLTFTCDFFTLIHRNKRIYDNSAFGSDFFVIKSLSSMFATKIVYIKLQNMY